FMWEQWNPGCAVAGCTGTAVDQRSSESFSHGWGAAGISGILRSLLGIDVTGPGAATIRIAPPTSGLRHARGTEWTERGRVSVDWQRTGHGFTLDVTVPVNVTATVVLPGRAAQAWGDGAPRRVDERAGSTEFTVGSGRTQFRSYTGSP
ncbi:MAG: alpha-L-rhamnosidase, partial [Mycobacteriales bacterium]